MDENKISTSIRLAQDSSHERQLIINKKSFQETEKVYVNSLVNNEVHLPSFVALFK